MAINFYCFVERDNSPCLVCYDYNPIWNTWFPFYDDINKTAVQKNSNSKTYKELVNECDDIMSIDLEEKIKLVKNRFREIIADVNFEAETIKNDIMYEIKYSKSTNLYTIYKLYNFVITNIDSIEKLLTPKKVKCKLTPITNIINENIISNAQYLVLNENISKYVLR